MKTNTLQDKLDQLQSERMAFLLGWRHAEKGRARKPNPFDGIDEGLALMWDAGYHEGEPENVKGEPDAQT